MVLLSDPALPPVASSGIRAKDWLNMAAVLEREYVNWDGFFILHGLRRLRDGEGLNVFAGLYQVF